MIPPLFHFKITVRQLRNRCMNKNSPAYHRYGGRGIKCAITAEEIQQLWIKNKAYLIKSPVLDRIDSNGHYEKKNCRFISRSANSARQWFNKGYNKRIPKYLLQRKYGIQN